MSVSALVLCPRLTGAAKLLTEHSRPIVALAANLTESPLMLSTLKGSQLFEELDDSEQACRHGLSKYLEQVQAKD